MELSDIKKIYFVGIGGIGMSALARYFRHLGAEVHGYDKTETALTKKLVKEGMHIHYEENLSLIPDGIDLVVFTPAVPAGHLELRYFREQQFPVKKRAEVLGIISRSRKTAAIAGTHGKTTTSSILTYLLRKGGVDCTAFLGGIARNFDSNYVSGAGPWVVVEADEYDRSFLHLSPDIAVILSMEPDHLDIYGDETSILETGFMAFAKKRKAGGRLLVNHRILPQFQGKEEVQDYGLEYGAYHADNIRVEEGFFTFDFHGPEGLIEGLQLAMPGRHNVENATAAVAVALQIGVSKASVREALRAFRGIKRRFEIVYRDGRRAYIDDYAHHPSELRAAIDAARELFPGRRVTGIFQPHLYSRTRDFAGGFARALDQLDELLLLDIYPAREAPITGVTSAIILDRMTNPNRTLVSKAELPQALEGREIEVLLTLGAGDIDTLVQPIAQWLKTDSR